MEQQIRERAYEIWESEGRTGNPEEHWLRAEQELKSAASAQQRDTSERKTRRTRSLTSLATSHEKLVYGVP
jgi:hypothetical protein